MEEMLELLLPLAVLVVSYLVKSSKSKKAVIAHKEAARMRTTEGYLRQDETKYEQPTLRPAAPAAATKIAEKKPEPEIKVQQVSMEGLTLDHQHEGRQDVPCPAVEREMPHIRTEEKTQPNAKSVPGLKLSFDRNTVLQGFVMSEILNRPRPGMRR